MACVFVDTNVLYAARLRDILLDLAVAGVVQLRWSPGVLDELVRAIRRYAILTPAQDPLALVAAMTKALPDALVIPLDAATLPVTLPDPADHHVLAAALHAGCDMLLTSNLRHFPADTLLQIDPAIRPLHPDAYLIELITTRAAEVLPIIDNCRRRLTRPPFTVAEYIAALDRVGLRQTANLLGFLLQN